MLCSRVLSLLSEFFDEALDADAAAQISQHLEGCAGCRKEYDRLAALHSKLRSLERIPVPDCLGTLVQRRITNRSRNLWHVRLREELERCWSRIRTLESMWYVTRVLGTVVASSFFFLISYAVAPLYVQADAPRVSISPYGQQVGTSVLEKLGLIPAQPQKGIAPPRVPVAKSDAAIDDQYLSNFGESISKAGNDYDFSVVTYVDSSGTATIQNVLEHPTAHNFVSNFNKVISSGRFAPARENGEAVSSHMVLMFCKISVYN
jgi:hypothetical protein